MPTTYSVRLLAATSSPLALSACGKKLGPYPVTVNPSETCSLRTTDNETLSFQAGRPVSVRATYLVKDKRIQLDVRDSKVVFEKASYDTDTETLTADAAESGQNVGVSVKKTQICNPDCEEITRSTEQRSCTRYEQRQETYCRWNGHHQQCHTRWVSYPIPGWHWVEFTTITRTFRIDSVLNSLDQRELARSSDTLKVRDRQRESFGPCF